MIILNPSVQIVGIEQIIKNRKDENICLFIYCIMLDKNCSLIQNFKVAI